MDKGKCGSTLVEVSRSLLKQIKSSNDKWKAELMEMNRNQIEQNNIL